MPKLFIQSGQRTTMTMDVTVTINDGKTTLILELADAEALYEQLGKQIAKVKQQRAQETGPSDQNLAATKPERIQAILPPELDAKGYLTPQALEDFLKQFCHHPFTAKARATNLLNTLARAALVESLDGSPPIPFKMICPRCGRPVTDLCMKTGASHQADPTDDTGYTVQATSLVSNSEQFGNLRLGRLGEYIREDFAALTKVLRNASQFTTPASE